MNALLLIAHGSRRQASNEEVISLATLLSEEMKAQYPIVKAGFLELAEPLIPDAIESCITQGATDICILPYFLSAGRHVQEDVPAEVEKSQKQHPNIHIKILPHIGGAGQMIRLIRDTTIEYCQSS